MAFIKIISGVIYIISLLLPYGILYEAAWVRYKGLRIFQLGVMGSSICFLVMITAILEIINYVKYLWVPKAYFYGLRPGLLEKSKEVVNNGKVSVSKIIFTNIAEIALHIMILIVLLVFDMKGVSSGDVWFDSYGPARYLMFLAVFIGIIGSVFGILMANVQAADEMDWWRAVYEGRINASGAYVNTPQKSTAGTRSPSAANPSSRGNPVAERKGSYCPQCGAQCKPGALFCSKCGTKLED